MCDLLEMRGSTETDIILPALKKYIFKDNFFVQCFVHVCAETTFAELIST